MRNMLPKSSPSIGVRLILGSTLLLVSACSTTPIKKGDWVAQQWRETIGLYHAEGLYPPSEDMHLGDVYAVAICNDDDKATTEYGRCSATALPAYGTSVKIGHVDFSKALADYYDNVWPSDGKVSKSLKAKSAKAKEKFDYQNLPFASLPGFTLVNHSALDASASIPIQIVNAMFGVHINKDEALTIKIEGVQIIELPASVADAVFEDYCYFNQDPVQKDVCSTQSTTKFLKYELGFAQAIDAPKGKTISPPNVMVVTKVILARSISYSYSADSSFGAQGKVLLGIAQNAKIPVLPTTVVPSVVNDVAPAVPAAAPALKAAKPVVAAVGGLGAAASPVTSAANDIVANPLVAATSALNALMKNAGSPGVTVSYTNVSDAGVTITETFDRPIVVGYRGIQYPTIAKDYSKKAVAAKK